MQTNKQITINAESELFCIPCANGYTCLGFDVLERRTVGLARELAAMDAAIIPMPAPRGTLARYQQYMDFCAVAADLNRRNGWRSSSELTPQLVGLEGKRVEVTDAEGNKRRFTVGKSTGHIPD